MKEFAIIRNTKLFKALKGEEGSSERAICNVLFNKLSDWETLGVFVDARIPTLSPKLDYIEFKPGGVYFHEVENAKYNNSFVVKAEEGDE